MSVRRVQHALVAALGPDAHVEHRANHTGVGKLSFAVRVGDRALWAKVAADADEDESLATWARVAGILAERHAAPPVLDVLSVDGRTALLFPYLDAPQATRGLLHERYDEARALLAGLHSDTELAALLGEPTTTADCFRRIWLQRFEADLDVIEGYVGRDVHAYLFEEVDALGVVVDALDDPAPAPVHGDPWHENFLVGPDRVWLLDWEDLSVGDPVVDDAILLPRRARHRPAPLAGHRGVRRRPASADAGRGRRRRCGLGREHQPHRPRAQGGGLPRGAGGLPVGVLNE